MKVYYPTTSRRPASCESGRCARNWRANPMLQTPARHIAPAAHDNAMRKQARAQNRGLPPIYLVSIVICGCSCIEHNISDIGELMKFHSKLRVGQSSQEVRDLYATVDPERLRMGNDFTKDGVWKLRTPSHPGGENWILNLYFKDDQLAGIRIRTEDESGTPPSRPFQAPDDIGVSFKY